MKPTNKPRIRNLTFQLSGLLQNVLFEKWKFLFSLFWVVISNNIGYSQYVSVSCDGFSVNGSSFRPLIASYCVDFYFNGSSWEGTPHFRTTVYQK